MKKNKEIEEIKESEKKIKQIGKSTEETIRQTIHRNTQKRTIYKKTYKTAFNQLEDNKKTEPFIGESIEDKVRRTTQTKEPIEAISPMLYTERKEGVRPDTNIRTDKWELAQEAMNSISEGVRQKREERLKEADKPKTTSTEREVIENQ